MWILAVSDSGQTSTSTLMSQLPHEGDVLAWCQTMAPGTAAVLLMVGVIYLLFGFKIFRAVVLLNAAMVGAHCGSWVGNNYFAERENAAAVCAIIGAFAAAGVTWPTMKFAVALMGGIFGALLGGSIWHTANLEPNLVWAGALVGLVGFGLLSFVLFRGSVMMYTSLQGAFMLVFGALGLIYKYQQIGPQINDHLKLQPLLFPMSIFIPAVVGWIFQHHSASAPAPGKK